MKKNMMFMLVLLITLFVAVAPALAQDEPDLVKLWVVNDTDSPIWISLSGAGANYYLPAADGTTAVYTVRARDV